MCPSRVDFPRKINIDCHSTVLNSLTLTECKREKNEFMKQTVREFWSLMEWFLDVTECCRDKYVSY